jgi:hypothetical protein
MRKGSLFWIKSIQSGTGAYSEFSLAICKHSRYPVGAKTCRVKSAVAVVRKTPCVGIQSLQDTRSVSGYPYYPFFIYGYGFQGIGRERGGVERVVLILLPFSSHRCERGLFL